MITSAPAGLIEPVLDQAEPGLLGLLGLRIFDPPAETTARERTTTGITEAPAGAGIYSSVISAPTQPGSYLILWDWVPGGSPLQPGMYATEQLTVQADWPDCTPSDGGMLDGQLPGYVLPGGGLLPGDQLLPGLSGDGLGLGAWRLIQPTVQDVVALIGAYARRAGTDRGRGTTYTEGAPRAALPTFDDDTTPTLLECKRLCRMAAVEVDGEAGPFSLLQLDYARQVATLRACALIEQRRNTTGSQEAGSVYGRLIASYLQGMDRLRASSGSAMTQVVVRSGMVDDYDRWIV